LNAWSCHLQQEFGKDFLSFLNKCFCIKAIHNLVENQTKAYMKRISFVALLAFSTTFLSCQKEVTINQPNLDVANRNPTSYLLRRINTENATNGQHFTFAYNADHQVVEMKRIQWGYGPINVTPIEKWYDTTTYRIAYQGGLPVKCTLSDRFGLVRIFEYSYKGQQLSMRIQKFDENTIDRYDLYHYDSAGRLTEIVDSSNQVDFRYKFEYQGNLTAVTTYNLQYTPQKKSKTEYENFDTKVNYIRAVNGLPETHNSDGMNIGAYSSFSPNNYSVQKHYWDVEMNQSFNTPTVSTYTYEYNDQGLPVKKKSGGTTWTFEYQKYK